MKNAISEIWLIGLVVLFIMSFVGFLAVTISYSKCFKIKDMALTKIETHGGISNKIPSSSGGVYVEEGTLQAINAYLVGNSYRTKGKCPKSDNTKWYGIKNLEFTGSVDYEESKGGEYFYCVAKGDTVIGSGKNASKGINTKYYKVAFFYRMDIPVLGDIFCFVVDGQTSNITNGMPESHEIF